MIVANSEVSSVRDSDRIIGLLDSKTVEGGEGRAHGETPTDHPLRLRTAIEDVLEILSVPLLGIIPESEAVLRASNLGTPVTICSGDSPPARAYTAAARRLAGAAG